MDRFERASSADDLINLAHWSLRSEKYIEIGLEKE